MCKMKQISTVFKKPNREGTMTAIIEIICFGNPQMFGH